MPATATALQLEQLYGLRVAELWRRVQAGVLAQYDALDREDLAVAFRRFVASASTTIALGQDQAQSLAAAFVQQYVELETGRAYRIAAAGDGIAGTVRDGATVSQALAGAAGATWLAVASGRSIDEALLRARYLVGQVASTAVSDAAARETGHQAERSRGLMRGWTWVASGSDTCPACLSSQDGRTRPWSEGLRRHPGCSCIRSPVMPGVRELIPRPTGEELFAAMTPEQQAGVFKAAGADKAALIRDGQATLADFVARDRIAAGPVVTEAPLQAVAPAPSKSPDN